MKNKIYVVKLITTSVQTKLVQATSKDKAVEIAVETEWMGKEEMIDSKTKARLAVLSGNEKKGEYPDYHPSNYIFTEDGDEKRYSEF